MGGFHAPCFYFRKCKGCSNDHKPCSSHPKTAPQVTIVPPRFLRKKQATQRFNESVRQGELKRGSTGTVKTSFPKSPNYSHVRSRYLLPVSKKNTIQELQPSSSFRFLSEINQWPDFHHLKSAAALLDDPTLPPHPDTALKQSNNKC